MRITTAFACSFLLVLQVQPLLRAGDKEAKSPDKKLPQDYSTPQKTYATYLRAILANDLPAAKDCCIFTGGKASEALDVIVGIWVTAHHINQAAREKIGEPGWAVLHEWNGTLFRDDCTDDAIQRTLARIEEAKVELKDDTAVLRVKWKEGEPLKKPVFHYTLDDPIARMRKVKSAWKIDVNSETGLTDAADFFKGTWGPMMRDMRVVQQAIASEIVAGKLKTDKETIAAFEKRLEPYLDKHNPGWRIQAAKAKAAASVKVPDATDFDTAGLAWSSTHCPTVAVSDSGVVYAFWLARGMKNSRLSPALPPIPAELAFGNAPEPTWSSVPGVNVYRKGGWSKAGTLLSGLQNASPDFAWCEGEKVHLLISGSGKEQTHHLLYDPATGKWTKKAELTGSFGNSAALRIVGNKVHAVYGRKQAICYRHFDGKSWSDPLRLDEDKHSGGGSPRMAIDGNGTVHVIKWSITGDKAIYRHVFVTEGKVHQQPLKFDGVSIHQGDFAIGTDPKGRVLIAYRPDLPAKHADADKVHVCYRTNKGWSAPVKIEGGGKSPGYFHITGNAKRTLVTWIQREDYPMGGGILATGFRRMAVLDGETWSPARWIARNPTLRREGTPVGAMYLGHCLDQKGSIHMVWDCCSYCLVTNLNAAPAK